MRKIELLAPAANPESGRAAIDHGADALYVGGPAFGARRAAANSCEQVARLIDYARPFGVRVYAALNTLIFEDELTEAERIARELISAGIDALIIQDMAFLRMGLPPVEFHASTQTFNASPEKVRFLEESGFSRVILERGLSLETIKNIRNATTAGLECFVHGAICVGYSGRCFLSRSIGPRSGNRGECSQPCRMTYDLTDSNGNAIIEGKHLLSVRDLDMTGHLGELLDAGVDSFKVEGRLKDTAYVKNVTAHYRRELDKLIAGRTDLVRASSGRSVFGFGPAPSKTFTRGATDWMFRGKTVGQASFDTPKALGEYIGRVKELGNGYFRLDSGTLDPGDGICFISEGRLTGTNVNRCEGDKVFPNKMAEIIVGAEIYRNYDHNFAGLLTRTTARRSIGVRAEVGLCNGNVALTVTDEDGNTFTETLPGPFESARDPEKMETALTRQLSKSGDTIFDIADVKVIPQTGTANNRGENGIPFIPIARINELRRRALAGLLQKRTNSKIRTKPGAENASYTYLSKKMSGEENVANPLAEKFYRDHGVEVFEPAWELSEKLDGRTVMVTPYCIRRETGLCRKNKNRRAEPLYLKRGTHLYRIEFDCRNCEMHVIKEPHGIA